MTKKAVQKWQLPKAYWIFELQEVLWWKAAQYSKVYINVLILLYVELGSFLKFIMQKKGNQMLKWTDLMVCTFKLQECKNVII